jgi:hypothetical protein
MKFSARLVFAGLALLFTALPLNAQGIRAFLEKIDWSLRGSVLFFPEKNGNASAPMPILPSLGTSASYDMSDLLAMEVSLDVYGNTYDYDYDLKRAVPANDEFRTSFVIGFLLGFQPVLRFRPMGDKFTIRTYGGLAFDLRIIFRAYGIDESDEHTNNLGPTGHNIGEASKDISSYFWSNGRFIFPFIGGGIDFNVLDGIILGLDLRAWFPVWRAWTGEDLPFIEGFRFGVGFRATFK